MSAPNFDNLFDRRPDLEPPGYKEALMMVRSKALENPVDEIKIRCQLMQKEKVSARTKERNKNKRGKQG